jgi:hypothetical protein
MSHNRILATTLIALATIPACGKSSGRVKVYPAQGKVLVRAIPVEGATVVFYPVADVKTPGIPAPNGTTDSQGVYKLSAYGMNDGAPEGEYKVSIIWPEPLPPNLRESADGPKDRLGGRYSDPQKSKLTAKIEKGGGEIPPFELQ